MPPLAAPHLSDGVVVVRGLREDDIPAIVAACQDPDIPRWTRVPSPYMREDAVRFLALAAAEAAAGAGLALAIARAEDDRLIGTVGLMGLPAGRGDAELGYWTAAAARGRGATSRAVVLLRDWAAGELGVERLEILAHRDNAPSLRVAEKAGFTATGEERRVPRMPPGRQSGYRVFVWPPPGS
jgi:RimJ/RimL family protein N-acetyltransferase